MHREAVIIPQRMTAQEEGLGTEGFPFWSIPQTGAPILSQTLSFHFLCLYSQVRWMSDLGQVFSIILRLSFPICKMGIIPGALRGHRELGLMEQP